MAKVPKFTAKELKNIELAKPSPLLLKAMKYLKENTRTTTNSTAKE